MLADEAAWIQWFNDGLWKAHERGDCFDRESWNNDKEGKRQRPEGSKELDAAYEKVWRASGEEEWRRFFAERALESLNKCRAEVEAIKKGEACV